MNKYKLEYWNSTGCYKTEFEYWACSGERYILEKFGAAEPDYYIVAYKQ